MRRSRIASCKRHLVGGGGVLSSALSFITNPLKHIPVGDIVNTAIDALPVELHLPGGYQYCGPGTKLKKRLSRGDPGINKLDKACKEHDIRYSKYKDTAKRTEADKVLAGEAWKRVKSSDASLGEKAAALAVTAAMKGKTVFGGGKRRKRRKGCCSKKGAGVKKGGAMRKGRKRRARRSKKKSIWSMLKTGQGLYLRPYRVY